MERADRRVRKTKKLLLDGLAHLMQQKSIKEITVRELTDLVDVNRGTFYSYYKDIYNMLEQIEQEMFVEFSHLINRYEIGPSKQVPLLMLIDLFCFLGEHDSMCAALLGKNGDIAFTEKLKSIAKERFLHAWTKDIQVSNPKNFEYHYSFIVSGFIGLLQCWLENGKPESAEEIAVLARQIIMMGMKSVSLLNPF